MTARMIATLSLLLFSCVTVAAETRGLPDAKAQKAAVKCQKAIDQAGAKLVATKLKHMDACSTAVLGCIQVKPLDTACLQKASGKCSKAILDAIPQAEESATAKIVKSCGTPLRPADLLASDGLGIGAQAATCNGDFGLNVCSDLPTLARCLVATNARGAERVFAGEQPRARELIGQVLSPLPLADLPPFEGCADCAQSPSDTLGKAVAACGATVTKAGRTFASVVAKGLGGCIDKVFACLQTKPGEPKCLAKAATSCDGATAKLVAARSKLSAAVAKRCADTGTLPFATLAAKAALNLDALAADCAALGAGPLGTLDDYVACVRRQHECRLADVLRRTLPRTAELVDAGLLSNAGELLDAAQCPPSLPSDALLQRRTAERALGTFSISRFFGIIKKVGGVGVKAATVSSTAPPSSLNAARRVSFPLGIPGRFVPGSTRIVKVSYKGASNKAARGAALGAVAPTMIVAVKRGDLLVDDHLEIPLDAISADEDGEVDLEIEFAKDPPSCVFGLAFAVDDGGEVSDYTEVEQVADTVPPPTPVPTATPTIAATLTPTATGATPQPTPPAIFGYALTTSTDPVAPGGIVQFTLTVTNRTDALQSAKMSYMVPSFTTVGGYGPGVPFNVNFNNVPANGSRAAFITVKVANGVGSPPDGTLIELSAADSARGITVARTIEVQSAAAAEIRFTSTESSVAPGGVATYAIAYHNVGGSRTDVELRVPVPTGATFASASAGGDVGVDGVVRWPLATLAAGATGEVNLRLKALANANTALLVDATLADGGPAPLAHASTTTAVYATPVFAYALTTTTADPVAPGGVLQFTLTLTNLTNATQDATVSYRVPDFTTVGGYGPGVPFNVSFNGVPAYGSRSAFITLTVANGVGSPPNGTLIELGATDGARGVTVTRTVVVQAPAPAEVRFTAAQGSVTPGGVASYTIAYHNAGPGPRDDLELRVPLPAGTSFGSAPGGGELGADGLIHWPLGTLAAAASGEVSLQLTVLPTARAALLLEATLADLSRTPLARASTTTAVYGPPLPPVFAYALTTTTADPVAPGGVLQFTLTLTNLTNATQDATVSYRVPNFTTVGGYGPGEPFNVGFNGVPAYGSRSAFITLTVANGVGSPPNGTLIELDATDGARGVTVTRTVVVQSPPPAEVRFTAAQGSVPPAGDASYTISYHNAGPSPRTDLELRLPLPAGASFGSATGGGELGADGLIRWPVGALAAGATGEVNLRLTALASARAALVLEATLADLSRTPLARASITTAVYGPPLPPVFAYALTTTTADPVAPGGVLQFTLTLTNLTNATQDATVSYRVPDFTTVGGYGPGAPFNVSFNAVPAYGSRSAFITLTVANGVGSPPNGTLIELDATDGARGVTVTRTVVVQAPAPAEVRFTAAQGSITPGGVASYTIAYHNAGPGPRTDLELRVPVPAGANFAGATGGGELGDGIIRWPVGTLAAGATGEVTLQLTALATTRAALLLEATLADLSPTPLARASTTTAVYATPAFAYALTTTTDLVTPGGTVQFTVTLTNLTDAPQNATVSYRVPNFTTVGGYGPGEVFNVGFGSVAASAAPTRVITLTVKNGTPPGTLIDLTVVDGARGSGVSRTVVVE